MESVDVLVVGSGPAGSTTARYAAEGGASVLMIERRKEVGVPVRCGEFMVSNEEILGMFPNLADAESLFEVPDDLRLRQIDGIDLIDPKGKAVTIGFDGYTTDRDRFDQYLARRATEAGANLETGCGFISADGNVARTSRGEIRYRVLVGADGPSSRVASSLGLPRNRNPYPAVTAQVEGDFGSRMSMYFGGIAPGAYGWIIPKDGRANVGVGFSPRFAKGDLLDYFDKFAERHGLEPHSKVQGKTVPSEGPIAQTVSGNGMVVGDAAGMVISVNGGGIPLAMIGGRICGRVAAENIRSGSPLATYDAEWRAVMEKPLKTAAFNKKLADAFAFRSDVTTGMCMAILGRRRMANLIRCKRIFPRSLPSAGPQRGSAYRALRHRLPEPPAASGAAIAPLRLPGDPLGAHRPAFDAEGAGGVLDRVVVGEYGAVHVEREREDRHVHRRQPSVIARPAGRLPDPGQGLLRAVRGAQQVPPQGQAGIVVGGELPQDPGRADVVPVGRGVHREERRGVEHEHAPSIALIRKRWTVRIRLR